MGVELAPDEVAYRCNLVTLGADGTMVDFAAGHLTSAQSHPIVAALDAALGDGRDGVRFHAGVEYRHLVRRAARLGRRRVHAAARPHRQAGGAPDRSRGREAHRADGRVAARSSRDAAARGRFDRHADLALGPGRPADAAARSPSASASTVASRPRSISCAGSACSPASRCVDVPGATAGFDNDYGAQRDACLESLADRDFFLLHVEATDEAGHQQDAAEKVARARIVGPRRSSARSSRRCPRSARYRVLLLPDHATPCRLGTHTSDPVPYLLVRLRGRGPGPAVHRDEHRGAGPRRRP